MFGAPDFSTTVTMYGEGVHEVEGVLMADTLVWVMVGGLDCNFTRKRKINCRANPHKTETYHTAKNPGLARHDHAQRP